MRFLNSKAKGTRVGNAVHINYADATLISQENHFQGPSANKGVSNVVVLKVWSQGQQDGHLLATC